LLQGDLLFESGLQFNFVQVFI